MARTTLGGLGRVSACDRPKERSQRRRCQPLLTPSLPGARHCGGDNFRTPADGTNRRNPSTRLSHPIFLGRPAQLARISRLRSNTGRQSIANMSVLSGHLKSLQSFQHTPQGWFGGQKPRRETKGRVSRICGPTTVSPPSLIAEHAQKAREIRPFAAPVLWCADNAKKSGGPERTRTFHLTAKISP